MFFVLKSVRASMKHMSPMTMKLNVVLSNAGVFTKPLRTIKAVITDTKPIMRTSFGKMFLFFMREILLAMDENRMAKRLLATENCAISLGITPSIARACGRMSTNMMPPPMPIRPPKKPPKMPVRSRIR